MAQRIPWLLLLVWPLVICGCGDDKKNPASSGDLSDRYVTMVRTGHFSSHPAPEDPIGEVFDRYLANPKWESLTGTDGQHYVNVSGRLTYMGEPVTALIQFRVNYEAGTFVLSALEFNGVAQSVLMIAALVNDIYDEAGKVVPTMGSPT